MNPLPQLLDRKSLAAELGAPRSTIDHIFTLVPVVRLPRSRKPFVRRDDVEDLLRRNTFGEAA